MTKNVESNKNPVSFLLLLVCFVAGLALVIASLLSLGIEPMCDAFGVLCNAGVIKLIGVGLSISTGLTVIAAVTFVFLLRSWDKQNRANENRQNPNS